jgi:hypothetical protein
MILLQMKKSNCFENYPCWMIVVSSLFSLLVYFLGAYILYKVGLLWFVLYLVYILFLEIKLMKKGCVNCYYYGKFCFSGKGKLSSLLFRRGNPEQFIRCDFGWKDVLPDFLVSIIPILAGVVLLIMDFNLLLLILLVLMFVLMSAGNGFVRGSLACNHCKQRELGCPAEKLFGRKK